MSTYDSIDDGSPHAPCHAIRALERPAIHIGKSALPSLVLSVVPGVVAIVCLTALSTTTRFRFLASLATWPWQMSVIAVAGLAATIAGAIDWTYHRTAGVVVGPRERRAELMALGLGGVPLFFVMAVASLLDAPHDCLVPALVLLVATTVMITYDEVAFHERRCAPVEHVLHRVLTGGHFIAFLAWAHLVFVAGMPRLPHG